MTELASFKTDAAWPPIGSCDCHVHVLGPQSRFTFSDDRSHTPPDAPLDPLMTRLGELGISRVVLVQMSIFGCDNSCVLSGLETIGDSARGLAVVHDDISGSELCVTLSAPCCISPDRFLPRVAGR